jgi:RNA polymerase sigma-70 factor (ECF subfamily)
VHQSDARLVERTLAGSRPAAAELFERYWTKTWKTAYLVTGDRAGADDVAQNALHRAFSRLDRFDRDRPFGPWLHRIVVNCAVDEVRRRHPVESLDDHAYAERAPEAPAERLRRWGVADAVAALTPKRRLVVVLRYWLDYPIEEIGEVLGIPAGTVASRLNRAHEELRALLREEEDIVA